jgi:hypothetical protein
MDIAGAYPAAAGVRHYQRTVRLLKGHHVEVEDVFDGDQPAEVSLMLAQRPELTAETIILPGLGQITISGAGVARLEEIDVTDPRLRKAWPAQIYRVLLPLQADRLHLTIT